jgi:hypothetical protein
MVDSRQNNDLVELIHAAWKQNLSELTNFGIWTLRGRGLFKHRRASNRYESTLFTPSTSIYPTLI